MIRLDAHRDEQHRDQQWHKPVRVATTANITISTALNAGDTLDGVTLAAGDRVLVKDQSTGSQNGIYVVGASPARAYDMLAGVQAMGAFVYVIDGTANGGTLWTNTNTTLPTVGSTALTFAEFTPPVFSGAVEVVAHGNMGSTETFTFAAIATSTEGPIHTGTLNADLTATFAGATSGEEAFLRLYLTQDGTGGWDITWPGSVVWPDGLAPSLDTTAGTVEIVEFTSTDGGTTWFGRHGGTGTSLTVEDEGTPLATAADTLDFVGAGVVASGTGGTKTITISGAPAGAAGGDLSGTYPNPSVVDDSHNHTTATLPTTLVGELLISDTPAGSPLVFDDILQNSEGTELLYAPVT